MKLKDGDPVREFKVHDLYGNVLNPIDKDERTVLLTFYRYASCPLCNMRIAELRREKFLLESLGVLPVAIFHSSADSIERYVGQQKPWFPIIPDPDRALYRLYDVTPSWQGLLTAFVKRMPVILNALLNKGYLPGVIDGPINMLPADFLLSQQGIVVRAYYGRDIGDHLSLDEIQRLVTVSND